MAFSFRAGTNWCHDFPKLARESGFYFNAHTARVRVDWNRISSIDIDRVIRDRDFQTIDENINHVIDYYLESEYDVKILDPNFVKLFRLAQLAVEYLLYCKQYLDQSVVILKEELKYKIAENVKLKEEVAELQNSMKEMKEKLKEKTRTTEVKSESRGEIHKCPHCPKTFVSASFANAHLMRRHTNLSEVLTNSSPVHEEYRAETEKLHNEIKTLKERLNQTERVIRNKTSNSELARSSLEDTDSFRDDQYRKYQEEIKNLKTLLFNEIRNIKRKEADMVQQENEVDHENVKELISQQENEIQRLRNQLQEQLTINANEVQSKLMKQEDYWKSKIEQLENDHGNDVGKLFSELKQTQESANHIKFEYEEKVMTLEKQLAEQSKLLSVQSEQLSNLTKDILDNQNFVKQAKKVVENNSMIQKSDKKSYEQKIESFTEDTVDSESSQSEIAPAKKRTAQVTKQSPSTLKANPYHSKSLLSKKIEESHKVKNRDEILKKPNFLRHGENKSRQENKSKFITNLKKTTKNGNKYSSLDESKSATSTASESETESEEKSESEEESEEEISHSSATHTETTDDEESSEVDDKIIEDNRTKRCSSPTSLETVKQELQKAFESRLRDLGIDPEWNGIPVATFQQKMETIKHQQNIASKKYPKYEHVRRKILEELSRRISMNKKSSKKIEPDKKSFLNKAMKNVKSKAMKALNDFKVQKNPSTPIMSPSNSTPRESQLKRKLSLELLPKKPTQLDIQEIMRQARLEVSRKEIKEEPVTRSKLSLLKEESIQQQVVETVMETTQRPKQLQRSYQSIEEFMRDIEETPKLDMKSTKITSTPSKNVKNILQDSYTFNDSDQSSKQDSMWALTSPKNNKSVLKSTSSVTASAVKKKVLFDLEKEESIEQQPTTAKSVDEFLMKESDDKKGINNSDWNSSSSEEKITTFTNKDKNTSTENIQLKTSQSEKIAEISRKIQEKLEASRRKPAGSVEAMFLAKSMSTEQVERIPHEQSSTNISSVLNNSSHTEHRSQSNANQVPRPAPRRQLFETNDIDELLTSMSQNKNTQKLAI